MRILVCLPRRSEGTAGSCHGISKRAGTILEVRCACVKESKRSSGRFVTTVRGDGASDSYMNVLTPVHRKAEGLHKAQGCTATARAVLRKRTLQAIASTISYSVLLTSRPPLFPLLIGSKDAKPSALDARCSADAVRSASEV